MTAALGEADSITQVLERHARTRPDQPAITELDFTDGDRPSRTVLTYAQLHDRSLDRANRLRSVLGEGEPVVLLRDSGADFVVDFLGCMMAGVVPVPAPELRAEQDRSAVRLSRLVDDAGARYGIGNVTPTSLKALGLRSPDTEPVTREQVSPAGPVSRDDIAYVQYTSGTTDLPRGVVVTHDNILREAEIVGEVFDFGPDSVCVNWLPLFHDFGLVMGLQMPLLHGGQVVLMTPRAFVRDPERWLRAISDFGGTHSPAPNFAYSLCVRKIAPDRRRELRLDTWRVAPNAAEPVRHETIADFQAAFGAQGFKPEAMRPCYGLAEVTLIATAPRSGESPRAFAADRESLAAG
ncbi:AMP-binding protein, partial [Saccharothrix coeruleofusca]